MHLSMQITIQVHYTIQAFTNIFFNGVMLALFQTLMHMLIRCNQRHLFSELTVIAPLDSTASILNPVNHFSTSPWTGKSKTYVYTFAFMLDHHSSCPCPLLDLLLIITMFMLHLHVIFVVINLSTYDHFLLLCLHTFLTNSISNLSLITKTKLGLSISPFLVIDDNTHKDMK